MGAGQVGGRLKGLTTALIMNALVMPGSGHMVIGEWIKGIIIGSLTLTFISIPLIQYTISVLNGLRTLSINTPPIDRSLEAIGSAWRVNKELIYPCLAAVSLLWLFGIIDILLKARPKNTHKGGL